MKKIEFKSQICTTREQSERLLALGLKKETADMLIMSYSTKQDIIALPWSDSGGWTKDNSIPAWSLHRLMEIMYKGDMFGFVCLTTHHGNIDTIYELVIGNIEGLIKICKFNQDYLEETK